MMNDKMNDIWDNLIAEVSPIMEMSEQMLGNVDQILQKYGKTIDNLDSDIKLPDQLIDEIKTMVIPKLDSITNDSLIRGMISSDDLYKTVVSQLMQAIEKLSPQEHSAKVFIVNTIRTVVDLSVKNKVCSLDDWETYNRQLKESKNMDDVLGYTLKDIRRQMSRKDDDNDITKYFYNVHPWEHIEVLLSEAHETIVVEKEHRSCTGKSGQGHVKTLIEYVMVWKKKGYMRPSKNIYPFVTALTNYWNDGTNLGSRQGLERTYKKHMYLEKMNKP